MRVRPDVELIGASDADIDFIAHAKQDIPKLNNEIKRLKEVMNQLKKEYPLRTQILLKELLKRCLVRMVSMWF
jgi:hypothetical protein